MRGAYNIVESDSLHSEAMMLGWLWQMAGEWIKALEEHLFLK